MSSSGNAAENLAETVETEEPSMDEILASIRQIIADDEERADGLSERDLYTHPSDPSNSNDQAEPVGAVDTDQAALTAMELEIEAALKSDLSEASFSEKGRVLSELAESQAVDLPPVASVSIAAKQMVKAEETEEVPETKPDQNAIVVAPLSPEPEDETTTDIQKKAEKVRSNLSASAAAGMSLEERLEKYRIRARQETSEQANETLRIAGVEPKTVASDDVIDTTDHSAAEGQNAADDSVTDAPKMQSLPAIVVPSAEDVAKLLFERHSGTMTAQMEEIIRPMARQWVADNLPTLVERLVREEIERVSRGRTA